MKILYKKKFARIIQKNSMKSKYKVSMKETLKTTLHKSIFKKTIYM